MKIFGHYLFEDNPELAAYQEDKRRRQWEADVRSCEADGKLPAVALPRVEFGELTRNGIPVSEKEQDRHHLRTHRRWAQENRCHTFNGQKYCYHTGKEIVTSI